MGPERLNLVVPSLTLANRHVNRDWVPEARNNRHVNRELGSRGASEREKKDLFDSESRAESFWLLLSLEPPTSLLDFCKKSVFRRLDRLGIPLRPRICLLPSFYTT